MKLILGNLNLRRLGTILLSIFWLFIISTPAFVLMLAMKGELLLRLNEDHEYRVWLIMDKEEQGVGWSSKNKLVESFDDICIINKVGFLLWEGAADDVNTAYCECYPKNDYVTGENYKPNVCSTRH
tara:strand:+ start:170 stop:547 length:378 start_codon:yes stop_codon:yes gene_type:complete